MLRHLPNLMTLANLFCGCMAIVHIFNAKLEMAGAFVAIAAVLDFLDGFAARLFNAGSALGKQLDSLADMVTFGVVPGMTLYTIYFMGSTMRDMDSLWLQAGQYFMFSVTLFSCLRLAKFNIDERQSNYFIGVPTPANTLMVMAFPFILSNDRFGLSPLIYHPLFLAALAGISSLLMVAEIPLLSLKFRSIGWKENKGIYLLLVLSLAAIWIFGFAAAPLIYVFYLILSIIFPPEKLKS
jgi:CDP-diacylglycerol--serine O-phosphatidyltransferase